MQKYSQTSIFALIVRLLADGLLMLVASILLLVLGVPLLVKERISSLLMTRTQNKKPR